MGRFNSLQWNARDPLMRVRFLLENILVPSLKLFSVLFKFIFFLLIKTFFAFFLLINQEYYYVKKLPSFLFSVSQVTSYVESMFKADAAFIEIEKKLKKVMNRYDFICHQLWLQNAVFLSKMPTRYLFISFFVKFLNSR